MPGVLVPDNFLIVSLSGILNLTPCHQLGGTDSPLGESPLHSPGSPGAGGVAGLAEALERELRGIRCEISVIADKIRCRGCQVSRWSGG